MYIINSPIKTQVSGSISTCLVVTGLGWIVNNCYVYLGIPHCIIHHRPKESAATKPMYSPVFKSILLINKIRPGYPLPQ